jgi:6-phosphogluconolactonase/glucosamine-6-phosphate isomerase/deaminase
MNYQGFKIERHGGGVGYIVMSPDGHIVSSQPSEQAARKWVDEQHAQQQTSQQTSAPPSRGKTGP